MDLPVRRVPGGKHRVVYHEQALGILVLGRRREVEAAKTPDLEVEAGRPARIRAIRSG